MDLNIKMLKNSLKNNIDIINSKDKSINSLISWEPNYHFKWNIKYINIYIYSPQNSNSFRHSSQAPLAQYIKGKELMNSLSNSREKLKIYNPSNRLKVLNLLENNKLKIVKINKYNNPLWLINKKNNSIRLRTINIRTAISNSRILLNILNKKRLGIMKYLEILKNRQTTLAPLVQYTKGKELMNCLSNSREESKMMKVRVSNINDKLYNNWYDLINIKKINTIMTGIKLEIHGRLTKRKKASRTRKYIFLKGSVKKNSYRSLIDKSSIRMKVINGSAGINIYISNKINILK